MKVILYKDAVSLQSKELRLEENNYIWFLNNIKKQDFFEFIKVLKKTKKASTIVGDSAEKQLKLSLELFPRIFRNYDGSLKHDLLTSIYEVSDLSSYDELVFFNVDMYNEDLEKICDVVRQGNIDININVLFSSTKGYYENVHYIYDLEKVNAFVEEEFNIFNVNLEIEEENDKILTYNSLSPDIFLEKSKGSFNINRVFLNDEVVLDELKEYLDNLYNSKREEINSVFSVSKPYMETGKEKRKINQFETVEEEMENSILTENYAHVGKLIKRLALMDEKNIKLILDGLNLLIQRYQIDLIREIISALSTVRFSSYEKEQYNEYLVKSYIGMAEIFISEKDFDNSREAIVKIETLIKKDDEYGFSQFEEKLLSLKLLHGIYSKEYLNGFAVSLEDVLKSSICFKLFIIILNETKLYNKGLEIINQNYDIIGKEDIKFFDFLTNVLSFNNEVSLGRNNFYSIRESLKVLGIEGDLLLSIINKYDNTQAGNIEIFEKLMIVDDYNSFSYNRIYNVYGFYNKIKDVYKNGGHMEALSIIDSALNRFKNDLDEKTQRFVLSIYSIKSEIEKSIGKDEKCRDTVLESVEFLNNSSIEDINFIVKFYMDKLRFESNYREKSISVDYLKELFEQNKDNEVIKELNLEFLYLQQKNSFICGDYVKGLILGAEIWQKYSDTKDEIELDLVLKSTLLEREYIDVETKRESYKNSLRKLIEKFSDSTSLRAKIEAVLAIYDMGLIYKGEDKYEEAISTIKKFIFKVMNDKLIDNLRIEQKFIKALVELGLMYKFNPNKVETLNYIESFYNKIDGNMDSWKDEVKELTIIKATILIELGKIEEGLDVFDAYTFKYGVDQEDQAIGDIYYTLGEKQLDLGRISGGIDYLNKALTFVDLKVSPYTYLNIERLKAEALSNIDKEESKNVYRDIIEKFINLDVPTVQEELVRIISQLANDFKKEDGVFLQNIIERVVTYKGRVDPTIEQSIFKILRSYASVTENSHDFKRELWVRENLINKFSYVKGLIVENEIAYSYLRLITIYMDLGNYHRGREFYERFLNKFKGEQEPLISKKINEAMEIYGIELYKLGKFDEANTTFKSVSNRGESLLSEYFVARILGHNNLISESRVHYKNIIEKYLGKNLVDKDIVYVNMSVIEYCKILEKIADIGERELTSTIEMLLIFEKTLQGTSSDEKKIYTLKSMRYRALFNYKLNKKQMALQIVRTAIENYEKDYSDEIQSEIREQYMLIGQINK